MTYYARYSLRRPYKEEEEMKGFSVSNLEKQTNKIIDFLLVIYLSFMFPWIKSGKQPKPKVYVLLIIQQSWQICQNMKNSNGKYLKVFKF